MKVKDLMTRNPESCVLTDTAFKAASIMKRNNCGIVPIIEDRRSKVLKGILTDRDLALYLGKINKPAKKISVKSITHNKVRTIHPDESLHQALKKLEKGRIHRLPVVDYKNRLQGILSLKDLATEAYKEKRKRVRWVKERDIATVVERISRSR